MFAVMAVVALVVYDRLGLMILKRTWFNVDLLWAAALGGQRRYNWAMARAYMARIRLGGGKDVDDNRSETYWNSFLETLPEDSPIRDERYVAEAWGDSPRLADELGALIVDGTKTATCSALWEYETEGSALPEVGSKTIVLDGNNIPLCIVETIEVAVRPYNEIDARFAYKEGEGDRSLEYWRDAHWRFFSRTLPSIGRDPTMEMPLVCERFRVIYN